MQHPELVDRLAILNAAHPRKLSEGLHHPDQLRKSWYFFFAVPGLPESVVHADNWRFFRHFLHDANPEYTPEETDRYVEAWSQRQRSPARSGGWCAAADGAPLCGSFPPAQAEHRAGSPRPTMP